MKTRWIIHPIFNRTVLGNISHSIHKLEQNYPEAIPSLEKSQSIFLFSDYGGEHKDSMYNVYSFMITEESSVGLFIHRTKLLRSKSIRDNRRFSFKKLSDKIRLNALNDFLLSADDIEGILLTFAIRKNIELFAESRSDNYLTQKLSKEKRNVEMKIITIAHLAAYVVTSLVRQGQDVMWITDDDAISSNNETLCLLTNVFANIIGNIINFHLGHIRCGCSRSDPGDNQLEDLLAIPDFAAGVVSEQFSKYQSDPYAFFITAPVMSEKMQRLSWWFSDNRGKLKRYLAVIDDHDEKPRSSFFHFFDGPLKECAW